MQTLLQALKVDTKPMSRDEMDTVAESAYAEGKLEDDYPAKENSKDTVASDMDVDYYTKPDGDGRFLVRVGTIAALSIGTQAEDYALKRVSVWSPQLEGEVFDSSQANRGNLELLQEVPDEVRSTAERAITTFSQIADALSDYTYA